MLPDTGFAIGGAIPLFALIACYAAGAARRRDTSRLVAMLRHTAFMAGAILFLLSIEGPFARWAHELFYVHQLGILIARIAAPLLIALAHSGGTLIAGLPRTIRHRVLAPVIGAQSTQRIWHGLTRPWVVTASYLGSLFAWEVPILQTFALSGSAPGLAMHFTLFTAALLFWTTILERRPPPHGLPYGKRLMMIWLAMLGQVALGAVLTVKTRILYPAYAAGERLMHVAPLADEQRGGVLLWIPSALLFLLTLLVVIHQFGRHEARMDDKRKRWTPSNSAILLYPTTAAALREIAAPKNRKLRVGLVGFAVLLFITVLGATITDHRIEEQHNIHLYRDSRF